MALTTGGFTTYAAIGNREDLTDAIYDISPAETPFVSMIGRGKAKGVYHEWQTDSLSNVNTSNAALEGHDAVVATSAPTVRLGNYCQISTATVAISGTQEVVDKAGRKSEMAYQIAKRGKEIRRDIEAIALSTQGQNAGDATTPRKARALESWLSTNADRGQGGADATAATASPTDATAGDMRTFTEEILKDVLQSVWTAGGDPTTLMVGAHAKGLVSGFAGRSSAYQSVDRERIQAAASLYAGDFGDLKVVPNRWQRPRSALVISPDYAAISYLRGFRTFDLAKIGDSERKEMLAEWTLEMKNEAAHGIAADLLTA